MLSLLCKAYREYFVEHYGFNHSILSFDIDTYSQRNKEMMDYHYQSAENGRESILKDVEYDREGDSNRETTYDGLIQEFVKLNIEIRQKTIDKEHKE